MLLHLIAWFHILIVIFISFYAFLFKKNRYDYVYLAFVYVMVLHWTFLNGECWISYLYKKLKYKNYMSGDDPTHTELRDLFNMKPRTGSILGISIFLFVIINVWKITKRNRIPIYLMIMFDILLFVMVQSVRVFKHKRTNKNYHLFLEIMKYIILVFGIFSVWIINSRIPKVRPKLT